MKLTRNTTDADDLFQEVMLKAWRCQHQFDGTNLGAWLCAITKNTFYDLMIRSRRRPIVSIDAMPTTDMLLPPVAPTQETHVMVSEIKVLLTKLPKHYRDILKLRAAGYSYQDMARKQRIKPGTVRSRISRAREAITELVK